MSLFNLLVFTTLISSSFVAGDGLRDRNSGKGPSPGSYEPIDCEDRTRSRQDRYNRRIQIQLDNGIMEESCNVTCWGEQNATDDTTLDVFNDIRENGALITINTTTFNQTEESLMDADIYQVLYEEQADGYEVAEGLDIEPGEEDSKDSRPHGKHRRTKVLGVDERFEITGAPIESIPEKYVGWLRFNKAGVCTATLIGSQWILTAAHCVHSGNGGNWFSNITFIPRRNRLDSSEKYVTESCSVFKGWAESRKGQWDMAICKLRQSPGIGYSSFGYNITAVENELIQIRGYPAGKAWGTMWGTYDYIYKYNWAYLYSNASDTSGGMSGGPWWNNMVLATHRGYVGNLNQGVKLTKAKYDWLCNLMVDRC